jgi:uncharacterized protein YuzE
MAPLAPHHAQRYPRHMRAHYDPEVDIALIVLESGSAVSEEHDWGLIDRNPDDDHLMGFEIWEASNHLPPELIAALPSPSTTSDSA